MLQIARDRPHIACLASAVEKGRMEGVGPAPRWKQRLSATAKAPRTPSPERRLGEIERNFRMRHARVSVFFGGEIGTATPWRPWRHGGSVFPSVQGQFTWEGVRYAFGKEENGSN